MTHNVTLPTIKPGNKPTYLEFFFLHQATTSYRQFPLTHDSLPPVFNPVFVKISSKLCRMTVKDLDT